jgi:hypothetical protein
MSNGVVHDRGADHRADEERHHRLVTMHDHDRLRRGAMVVVMHDLRPWRRAVVVMYHLVFLNVVTAVVVPVVATMLATVGERRGGEGCSGEEDCDLLEHLRLLSVLNAYCISRAWRPEVNR